MRKGMIAAVMMMYMSIVMNAQTKAVYDELVTSYVAQYRNLAVEEQKRSGIPAAITLAQGIHETVAGTSELAKIANNHFGIKCKRGWTGETFAHTDDAPDECFRKYASSEDSYRDHSDYLSHTPRYAGLFKLSATDYTAWAQGLKAAGYATNPRYAQSLIKLIEDYHLQEYTYAAMGVPVKGGSIVQEPAEIIPEHDAPVIATSDETFTFASTTTTPANIPVAELPAEPAPAAVKEVTLAEMQKGMRVNEGEQSYPPYGQLTRVNGLKAVYARKGETPLEYALKHDIRYERLLELNDLADKPLPFDMYLYLERKHFTADNPTRTLRPGESLLYIAQEEGVQLKFLRAMNLLEPGEVPAPGTVLELQHRAKEKPVLVAGTEARPKIPVPAEVPVEKEPAATVATATTTTTAETAIAPEQAAIQVPPTPVAVAEKVENIVEEPAPQPVATARNEAKEETVVVTEMQVADSTPATTLQQNETIVPVVAATNTIIEEMSKPEQKPDVQVPAATAPEQPKEENELDELKAKFDRFVYSNNTPAAEKAKGTSDKEPPPAEKTDAAADNVSKYYVVKKGDTAFSIAKRHNVSMRDLMEMNGLNFEKIKVGQKLKIKP